MAISQGFHARAIQERLERSIVVTMDTYGHLMEGMDEQMVKSLDVLAVYSAASSSRASA